MACPSGDGLRLVEFGLLPFAAVEHLAELFHGLPDLLEADVQRRETKAQDVAMLPPVAGAEITDDPARNQRLHDGVGAGSSSGVVLPGQADLRAALLMDQRRCHAQAMALTCLLYTSDAADE